MKNNIMLITYPDSFGTNLKELYQVIHKHFEKEIGAIHILPFYPSSGDRGFAPINYQQVSPEFGDWSDIDRLAADYEIMADFMINHLSKRSPEFQDFVAKHDQSEYAHLFLRFKDFWENGYPTQEEIDLLNKRKPCAPCVDIDFADGTTEKIWCTFDDEQMDLDLRSEAAWKFVKKTLDNLVSHGIPLIRLDALAFATKRPGTTCFFLEPDFWQLIGRVKEIGPDLAGQADIQVGDRIATLVSLSLTPLKLHEITSIDLDTEQVFCRAEAILFETGIYTKLPEDLGEQPSLALMDVAGAPAQVAVHVKAGDTVVVVGAGKAGLLCLAEAKKRAAPTGRVVCMEYSAEQCALVRELGIADVVVQADGQKPLEALKAYHHETERGKGCIPTIHLIRV